MDVPPTRGSVWWYRVAARNRVGSSDFGPPAAIDLAEEAVEAAPHLQPLALEAEAPALFPSMMRLEAAPAPAPAAAPAPAPAPAAFCAPCPAPAPASSLPEAPADPLPPLGGPLARLRQRRKRKTKPGDGAVEANLASGLFFQVLATDKPLPRSTMRSTFR